MAVTHAQAHHADLRQQREDQKNIHEESRPGKAPRRRPGVPPPVVDPEMSGAECQMHSKTPVVEHQNATFVPEDPNVPLHVPYSALIENGVKLVFTSK